MKAKLINEMIQFNFDKPVPHKRFEVGYGQKARGYGSKLNPRKKGGRNLSDEEWDRREFHEKKIRELEGLKNDYESEREDLKYELENLEGPDSMEVEEFDGSVQTQYGWKALDILNSGYSDEEKKKELRRILPAGNDDGRDPENSLVNDYNYYHPEYDEEKAEKIQKRLKALDNLEAEADLRIEKHENKIYNIENY